MLNAIGSNRESNPSRGICYLRAVPLGHVADKTNAHRNLLSMALFTCHVKRKHANFNVRTMSENVNVLNSYLRLI